ncbi:MAG: helicase-related protein [Phormidesmis sp.]
MTAIQSRSSQPAQPVPSGIRDNHRRGSVGAFLQERIQDRSKLAIVSAYFTIYAYAELKRELEAIEELRFLFGEPRFVRSLDPARVDKKSFKIEDEGLSLQNRLKQKRLAKECAEWIREKVQIRSIQQVNLLHGKMYHVSPPNNGRADAIMGSSNFTVRGLGLGEAGNNIELNLEVQDKRDLSDLKAWFEEVWEDESLVEDVKPDVLQYLEQLYQNHSPEFIYFKTLFHIFEQFLADQDLSGLLSQQNQLVDTEIWEALFEFQKDGARGAVNKILTHNGCIIADSVGLGKTYEALAVIRYFELRNYRVLVLCPKRLRENWTVYQAQNNSELNPFVNDRFGYTVLSHTDLSRESGKVGDIDLATLNWGNYDLIVIDESHNFRNNTRGRRDEDGNVIRKSRYERLMEDILQRGLKTKVLLLSATPVNNDLGDLRNQLYLLTEGKDNAFQESIGIRSMRSSLTTAQKTFIKWSKKKGDRRTGDLLEQLSPAFFKLLDELTIARSRRHIQTHYPETIARLGGFPTRAVPNSVFVDQIDLRRRFLSFDRINEEISQYQLALFNPIKYVLSEFQPLYNDTGTVFKQSDREHYLVAMMKVNFLKRLESSVKAFAITMDRTIEKIEALMNHLQEFVSKTGEDEEIEIDSPFFDQDAAEDDELYALMQVGKNRVYKLDDMDVRAWLKDLGKDRDQLLTLFNSAETVNPSRDAKLNQLKQLIGAKVSSPTINKLDEANRKVLVFTAFADTAIYLYGALKPWARKELGVHIALITGTASNNRATYGKADYSQILTNFSPRAKGRSRIPSMVGAEEIDLLIATDCISEGQNLQDCDYLINYDIHWNPVRIIQRFGRIDRIGSQNHAVQMVNFWPTDDLDKYIKLQSRVEARMALVDATATQEDNLLATETIKEELQYRDRQLLRMKDEVLDLEDFNESISLTDFTLDDFRMELNKFIEANKGVLRDAPLGLYTVVPTNPEYPVIQPGVIFCLRQKGKVGASQVNPLQPHFMVYVGDDGEVRRSFAQPKQILDIYRLLCSERTVPYDKLCDWFDVQTNQGAEMAVYDELLERVVRSIAQTTRRRERSQLQVDRSAVLTDVQKQVKDTTDFELITWLVIQDEGAIR